MPSVVLEHWRQAITPCLSTSALEALRKGLAENDGRLGQGLTVDPPPHYTFAQFPVSCACAIGYAGWQGEGLTVDPPPHYTFAQFPVSCACAIGYAGWQGEGLTTVEAVECYFYRVCREIDRRLGEKAGCRTWLNWFDDTPRDDMLEALLPEVDRELEQRALATM